jgi:hypothetical protein
MKIDNRMPNESVWLAHQSQIGVNVDVTGFCTKRFHCRPKVADDIRPPTIVPGRFVVDDIAVAVHNGNRLASELL